MIPFIVLYREDTTTRIESRSVVARGMELTTENINVLK